MALDPLAQLQELARADADLRRALDSASSPADLVDQAKQHNLELSEAAAQAWLVSGAGQGPSPEVLASISQGLSGSDGDDVLQELTEEALDAIAGGAGGHLIGEAGVGEAGSVGEAI